MTTHGSADNCPSCGSSNTMLTHDDDLTILACGDCNMTFDLEITSRWAPRRTEETIKQSYARYTCYTCAGESIFPEGVDGNTKPCNHCGAKTLMLTGMDVPEEM